MYFHDNSLHANLQIVNFTNEDQIDLIKNISLNQHFGNSKEDMKYVSSSTLSILKSNDSLFSLK